MPTRGLMLVVVCLLLLAAGASAQTFENFDGGAGLPAGWTADPPTGTPAVGWDADATPNPLVAGPYCGCCVCGPPAGPSANSGTVSLNFNNGTDTNNGGLASGGATSPVVTVSSLAPGTVVRFWCLWEDISCQPTGFVSEDQKFIEILDSAGTTVLLSIQLCTNYSATTCGAGGVTPPQLDAPCAEWYAGHFHNVDISGIGATSFRIRFRYNQVSDASFPDTGMGGWFVDDVAVICGDVTNPTTPVLVTPPDASVVSSPPGITLDWTDSTDTSACGPSPILNYDVEVDTTNPPVAPFTFSATPTTSTATTGVLVPGTYFWRVRARDLVGNLSPYSTVQSFIIEAPLPPLSADTLFVNSLDQGAQSGIGGFVDPLITEEVVLSAIYRDGNSFDNASQYRLQLSSDPTFTLVDFDSGLVSLVPMIPKDSRTPDLPAPVSLSRDTVYYWRILFVDQGGLSGPFSVAQSFRIGDDFEFGVRPGSSNHSRKCWIATASFGSSEAAPVRQLQSWRFGTVESSGAGRVFSRAYHSGGPALATATRDSRFVRSGVTAAASLLGNGGSALPLLAIAFFVTLGLVRVLRRN